MTFKRRSFFCIYFRLFGILSTIVLDRLIYIEYNNTHTKAIRLRLKGDKKMKLTIDNLKWHDVEIIRDSLMGAIASNATAIKEFENSTECEEDDEEEIEFMIREYVDKIRSLKRTLIDMGEGEEWIKAHIKLFGNEGHYVLDAYETLR